MFSILSRRRRISLRNVSSNRAQPYRLNVFPIEIPPLRERKEDIPLLAEYFIGRYARKSGKHIKHVNKKTLKLLQSYPWPGNIRELQNVIERSVILCETEIFSIDESWLPRQPQPFLTAEPKNQVELPRRLLVQEKDMIEAALKESRGRVYGPTGAAAKLGIPRSTLESKISVAENQQESLQGLAENMPMIDRYQSVTRTSQSPAVADSSSASIPKTA